MPRCFICDRVQASAEVRKVPKGYRCKDTTSCVKRLALKNERAQTR